MRVEEAPWAFIDLKTGGTHHGLTSVVASDITAWKPNIDAGATIMEVSGSGTNDLTCSNYSSTQFTNNDQMQVGIPEIMVMVDAIGRTTGIDFITQHFRSKHDMLTHAVLDSAFIIRFVGTIRTTTNKIGFAGTGILGSSTLQLPGFCALVANDSTKSRDRHN